jgi:hypothetical protein
MKDYRFDVFADTCFEKYVDQKLMKEVRCGELFYVCSIVRMLKSGRLRGIGVLVDKEHVQNFLNKIL